jgi:hypothetical protein
MPIELEKFGDVGTAALGVLAEQNSAQIATCSYLSSFLACKVAVQSQKLMEIKRTISRIAYRIEEKPEGGFIARCSDPNMPALEAASRFELEQQIKAKITAEMESLFPGLKIPFDQSETKFITLETKPDGGFTAQPGDTSLQSSEGGTKNAVEQWLTDKAVTLVEKNLPPELVEQLKHQQVDGKIQIAVTKVGAEGKVRHEYVVSTGKAGDLFSRFLTGRQKTSGALEPSNPVSASFSGSNLDSTSPITPGSNSSFLRFVAALVLIGMLFFFLYLKK